MCHPIEIDTDGRVKRVGYLAKDRVTVDRLVGRRLPVGDRNRRRPFPGAADRTRRTESLIRGTAPLDRRDSRNSGVCHPAATTSSTKIRRAAV